MRQFITLNADDIGKRTIFAFGRSWTLSDVMGYVQPGDVGKRIYLVDDILQVENDAQRDRRLKEEGGMMIVSGGNACVDAMLYARRRATEKKEAMVVWRSLQANGWGQHTYYVRPESEAQPKDTEKAFTYEPDGTERMG